MPLCEVRMVEQDIAALLVFGHDVLEVIVRQFVGADGADLLQGRRAQTGLGELADALHHLFVARNHGADAGTAGRVTLGNGVDHDDAVFQPSSCRTLKWVLPS